MMSSSEVADLRNAGEDINSELRIETHKLDAIENGGISLQCVNSSEFMVGKQTNFNGPVTIINCTDGSEPEGFRGRLPGKEEVVIKDRIMTPTVAASMENFVKKKAQEKIERKRGIKYMAKGACTKKFLKIPVFVWAGMLFVTLAGFITIVTALYLVDARGKGPSFITVNGKKFRFMSRGEWGAAKTEKVPRLILPVPYLVISHTATPSCHTQSECSAHVRDMQMNNINHKNFPDIKYNFLVGGDGLIYEGRGWTLRSEAKGKATNLNIDIAFIGTFVSYDPTMDQVDGVEALVAHARAMNYTADNYLLIPANMTCATESPGKRVFTIIKRWPHFSETWPTD